MNETFSEIDKSDENLLGTIFFHLKKKENF